MPEHTETLILGAGLAGLSCSYHIGHEKCLILEKTPHPYGHIHSNFQDGFTWDEGPHVSFTSNDYVKALFAKSVRGSYEEYEVQTGNYFQGHWIDHPAQSNLYQVPEPLRSRCLESFLKNQDHNQSTLPTNYYEWLCRAFGKTFTDNFSAAYTRKYWTVDPKQLTIDWIGNRVFKAKKNEIIHGSQGPLPYQTHYVKKVRYPTRGGYQAFAQNIAKKPNIILNSKVAHIDLEKRLVWTTKGNCYEYQKLINTIPLPCFVACCRDVPFNVAAATEKLLCSSLLIVNITAHHNTLRSENWIYVYDEDKYTTRLHFTEKLSPFNAPENHTGVQVEVYYNRMKPLLKNYNAIGNSVIKELMEMRIIAPSLSKSNKISFHTKNIPWANIIFQHGTQDALNTILNWLTKYGLRREDDDLAPTTDWGKRSKVNIDRIALAGRFGQWKYFWTDDCVLRGSHISI